MNAKNEQQSWSKVNKLIERKSVLVNVYLREDILLNSYNFYFLMHHWPYFYSLHIKIRNMVIDVHLYHDVFFIIHIIFSIGQIHFINLLELYLFQTCIMHKYFCSMFIPVNQRTWIDDKNIVIIAFMYVMSISSQSQWYFMACIALLKYWLEDRNLIVWDSVRYLYLRN